MRASAAGLKSELITRADLDTSVLLGALHQGPSLPFPLGIEGFSPMILLACGMELGKTTTIKETPVATE